jgi:DNA-binding response OmpR family regulator
MTSAYTILIIDDEPNLRRSLAMILQRAGYSITCAESAEQVHQYLQAGAYDLVFLDLKMPDINGLQLLPEIRRQYPEMPVLILTAHATLDSAIEAVRKGARDYLLKPINPEQILKRVGEVLAEQQQPRRRREIVGEIQNLLKELNQVEGAMAEEPVLQAVAPSADPARILRRGPFVLDLHARYASLGEQLISLSPTAFDYLATLVRHSPNPVSYETLVMESQGYKTTPVEAREMARWRIHELRKALETDTRNPSYIITVRDVGYRLIT